MALDVGAAAGGFTTVLLEAGARLVYAVDAGHGQLLGSLRQDPRVVNLESVNIADLDRDRVPERVEVVTIDVSYLSVTAAAAQLNRIAIAPGAHAWWPWSSRCSSCGRPRRRLTVPSLHAALAAASAGVTAAGWEVKGSIDSPVTGSHGAREMLLHAQRPGEGIAPRP